MINPASSAIAVISSAQIHRKVNGFNAASINGEISDLSTAASSQFLKGYLWLHRFSIYKQNSTFKTNSDFQHTGDWMQLQIDRFSHEGVIQLWSPSQQQLAVLLPLVTCKKGYYLLWWPSPTVCTFTSRCPWIVTVINHITCQQYPCKILKYILIDWLIDVRCKTKYVRQKM